MNQKPLRFNLKTASFKQRTEIINSALRHYNVIAATGSIIEAHLLARLGISGGVPSLVGCGTDEDEVSQLCEDEEKVLLLMTESIGADFGMQLIERLRKRSDKSIIILYILQDKALAKRVDTFDADAVVMAISFGSGAIAMAMTEILAGRRYRDPAFQHALTDQGMVSLTKREQQVLQLLQPGKTNKEIANDLSVAPVTIRGYIQSLMGKFSASNRTMLVMKAKSAGFL